MSDTQSLEATIRTALDAAETANNVAADIAAMKSAHHAASKKLDGFARASSRVVIGALIGATVSIALGGLVYFRALKEMRTLHAANLEALSMFTMTVDDLRTATDKITVMVEKSDIKAEAQMDAMNRVQEQLQATTDDVEQRLANFGAREQLTPADLEAAIASLRPFIEDAHQNTNATTMGAMSDLQLALTKLMAQAPKGTTSATNKTAPTTPKPAPKPKPKPRKAPPAPNPFSYP